MTEIRLANGRGVALIDDEDAVRVRLTGWYLHPQGYAAANIGTRSNPMPLLLHRVITNAPHGFDVDHIDHDKLNCQKANLRIVTRSQNNQNRKGPQPNNKVGIRGVSALWNRWPPQYMARVQVKEKVFTKGGFYTTRDAEAAAIELRKKHFTHSEECR